MSNSEGGISKNAFLWSELKNRHPPRVIVDGRDMAGSMGKNMQGELSIGPT
jgi:hypothetical protein